MVSEALYGLIHRMYPICISTRKGNPSSSELSILALFLCLILFHVQSLENKLFFKQIYLQQGRLVNHCSCKQLTSLCFQLDGSRQTSVG